jgi:oxygen-independent coproporphyrinogen-3 oxidase
MQTEPLEEATAAGNYFVSNYPPYAYWTPDQVEEAHRALDRAPAPGTPLGIYVHIPFCRKRCHFCYFKVYTDKDSSEIERYLDAAVQELTLYSQRPFIGGRKPKFIYFGGGTHCKNENEIISVERREGKECACKGRSRGETFQ